jgi:hypothetical protein
MLAEGRVAGRLPALADIEGNYPSKGGTGQPVT